MRYLVILFAIVFMGCVDRTPYKTVFTTSATCITANGDTVFQTDSVNSYSAPTAWSRTWTIIYGDTLTGWGRGWPDASGFSFTDGSCIIRKRGYYDRP